MDFQNSISNTDFTGSFINAIKINFALNPELNHIKDNFIKTNIENQEKLQLLISERIEIDKYEK